MPKVCDTGLTNKRPQLKIYGLWNNPSRSEAEAQGLEVDAWIYQTEDLLDPDIRKNELIWGMTTWKIFSQSRADFLITRWHEPETADFIYGFARTKSEVGWVSDHPLKGRLIEVYGKQKN